MTRYLNLVNLAEVGPTSYNTMSLFTSGLTSKASVKVPTAGQREPDADLHNDELDTGQGREDDETSRKADRVKADRNQKAVDTLRMEVETGGLVSGCSS